MHSTSKIHDLWKHWAQLQKVATFNRPSPSWLSIFSLLETMEHNKCSDPRDIIYALSGMADDIRVQETWRPPYRRDMGMYDRNYEIPLRITYSEDVETIYTRFAIDTLKQDYKVQARVIFAAVRRARSPHSDFSNLPSWVPDWRIPPSTINVSG